MMYVSLILSLFFSCLSLGTLSVYDALRVFSIRAMVAAKETPDSQSLVMDIIKSGESDFLRMDYIF